MKVNLSELIENVETKGSVVKVYESSEYIWIEANDELEKENNYVGRNFNENC